MFVVVALFCAQQMFILISVLSHRWLCAIRFACPEHWFNDNIFIRGMHRMAKQDWEFVTSIFVACFSRALIVSCFIRGFSSSSSSSSFCPSLIDFRFFFLTCREKNTVALLFEMFSFARRGRTGSAHSLELSSSSRMRTRLYAILPPCPFWVIQFFSWQFSNRIYLLAACYRRG